MAEQQVVETTVKFILENLKQLVIHNADLIRDGKGKIDLLGMNVRILKSILVEYTRIRSKRNDLKNLIREIRSVVDEAEHIMEKFEYEASVQMTRSRFQKGIYILRHLDVLRNVGVKIEAIKKKMDDLHRGIRLRHEVEHSDDYSNRISAKDRAQRADENNVEDFDNISRVLVDRLIGGSEELEVLAIVGMCGMGKTSLAKKVIRDASIQYLFVPCEIIYVSDEYTKEEVWIDILSCVAGLSVEECRKRRETLVAELHQLLRSQRFLFVLDDVWSQEDWYKLKTVFPETKNGSRILLTSQNRKVATLRGPPYDLRLLTDLECWEILRKKIFGTASCPEKLEVIGKQIAKRCYGLPFVAVPIADLLKEQLQELHWNQVLNKLTRGSHIDGELKHCMDVFALSYENLTYYWRKCFIYFGTFPEDFRIPVWLLLRLWVAEGFVEEEEQKCLEDTAEEYLEALVDRNLVSVASRRSNGRIKECYIHRMLRDFCLKEAAEESFLQVIRGSENIAPTPSTRFSNYLIRLSIHSDVCGYISSRPSGSYVRSFLCSTSDHSDFPPEHTSLFFKAFKVLRVLELRSICLSRFPEEIKNVVYLRYVALSGNFKFLPASISNLLNLQTLIIETKSRDLKVLAKIWKMSQLRHLHTNRPILLRKPPAKALKDNKIHLARNLQTISLVFPHSCTENILATTPNLKKLGISGQLVALMEVRKGCTMFDNLSKLKHLETLKLLDDTSQQTKLQRLPQFSKFPPNLKKLTLSHTLLDWDHMSTLGKLPHLKVLKLKDDAFKGREWRALDGGFQSLMFLQIGRTDLVEWEASEHHFPSLQHLILKHCSSLEAIPSGLGEVLQILELHCTSSSTQASARQIQQRRQTMAGYSIELLIDPPSS